ncbi:hypothetical protein NSA53_08615 [Cellulosimicrobium cellulans]|jgi:hypothetical protein|uniref:hypothetical protein n=1 Tax=Cellulosimicrobium TaxID=157920 RepID=UPI0008839BA4|nr:hypothetical protein [Sphaerisporangium cinnabarinum]MCR1982296.1 hypothetical protein [Cellulosimicrobium cellulans]PTU54439.1 hypothetical protein DBB34_19415 [Sphaerisporangium cinnabarinum]SDF33005.1 hypothetical protein SAMN04487781_1057 [Cellulosimicrobium cellulans]
MPTPPPAPCLAAPFGITRARDQVLTATDDAARARAALETPDLPWAGQARHAYDDATAEGRSALLRLDETLASCLAGLDALTVLAETDVASLRTELAAVGGA